MTGNQVISVRSMLYNLYYVK